MTEETKPNWMQKIGTAVSTQVKQCVKDLGNTHCVNYGAGVVGLEPKEFHVNQVEDGRNQDSDKGR